MSYAYLAAAVGIAIFGAGCAASPGDEASSGEAAIVGSADPAWLGNAHVAIARDTCGGGICDDDLRSVDGDIVYGTWARERAAVRAFTFEVFEPGATDQKASDLWQKLDVEVHSRVAGTTAFATRYVAFDKFVGNNARYALDLRALDPLTGAWGCPDHLSLVDGDAEVVVELYVTVNGMELRPSSAGSVYRVRYQNYASQYAGCPQ